MAFARSISAAYHARGLDPSRALAQARIAPEQLAAPDGRMTAQQMEDLSAAAMRELDDESLGAFSRPLPWGGYGLLARASLSAPDLGVALRRWCRHHGLLTDDVRLQVLVQAPQAAITLVESRPLPAAQRELALAFLLRNVHGLACWLVDSRIPLHATILPMPAPPHADAYARMFPGGPVRFEPDAPGAALLFDAAYLALPLRRDGPALDQLLRQRALRIAVRPYRRDRLLAPQVRQALGDRPDSLRDAAAVARALHVSVRTLHRQLREEGTSLQRLKDEVRLERARDLLLRSQRPVKQVAAAVGFQSEKSFARAFKAWAGMPPARFRQRGVDA